jgi:hypothetical protein
MELDKLKLELVDRLLVLETKAAHLSVMADIAAAYAHVAREKADTAQRRLSEVKIFLALLPDDTALELRAPMPADADPAKRLGVRLRLPAPRPDRGVAPCPNPPSPRPSKLRNAAFRPGDDAEAYCGGWSRERLIAMDARYCEVMRKAWRRR